MPEALIIIPTYNERENIGALIDGIFSLPNNLHVLVVDDESPDGTADVVSEKQGKYGEDCLQLIVRSEGKAGRGSACMLGFAIARERSYPCAIEMDADLSHDPNDIPRFLAEINNADVVIGSKYVRGSRIIGWGFHRRVLSFCANLYARLILRLPVRDYTNGYRCYGARALAILPDLPIDGVGFTVIPQASYLLHRAGMKLAEIPITFTNRRMGSSNMSMREISESVFAILKIRSNKLYVHATQLIRFAMTGGSGLVLDIALLATMVEALKLPLIIAGPASTSVVIIYVFLMNKHWTFRNNEKKNVEQGIKFTLVYASSFVLVNAITLLLAEILLLWYIVARLIAIATCAVWNYSWMHCHVFRREPL